MEWANVAVYSALVVGLAGVILGLTWLVTHRLIKPSKAGVEKLDPYECGAPIQGPTRQRFSVHFYLVAILFILFDIETVFLIPWAVLHKSLGVAGLIEMGAFLAVVGFGLVYIWRRGALEWD